MTVDLTRKYESPPKPLYPDLAMHRGVPGEARSQTDHRVSRTVTISERGSRSNTDPLWCQVILVQSRRMFTALREIDPELFAAELILRTQASQNSRLFGYTQESH